MSDTGLGIIAGGGELPCAIAESAEAAGRKVFVLAMHNAGDWVSRFRHEFLSMGQIGKTIALLHRYECSDIVLAGYVSRPNFLALRYDAKGLSWLFPVLWAMRKGDNTLLDVMVGLFEREGFRVKGAAEVAPALQIPAGVLGRIQPTPENQRDISLAILAAREQGARDIGQAVIVRDGEIVAIETHKGTDVMLGRLATSDGQRRGVLAKALKPIQNRKTDLPTIGVATIENAAAAGLAGVAIEAHTALVLDRARVIEAANRLGIFVVGVQV
jgi:DUF1009 family protein